MTAHGRTGKPAREWVLAHRAEIIARYVEEQEPMSVLASSLGVSATWLTTRFDAWGIPRRGRAEATALRGPVRSWRR